MSGAETPVLTPVRIWWAGARPKTLGVAFAPVLVGTAAGALGRSIRWTHAVAALVVSLALQVGVNYANDYSDGVRGTDKERRGPIRLVASGLASPTAVRNAAAALVRGRGGGRRRALARGESVAARDRARGARRGGHVHRRAEALRLSRPGRGHGARVLRLRRDRRQRVRAVPPPAGRGVVGCARGRSPGVRDPAREQRARRRDRCGRRQANPGRAGRRRAPDCSTVACLAGSLAAVVGCGVLHPWALIGLAAAPLAIAPARLVRTKSDPPSLVAALVRTVRFQLVLAVLLAAGLRLG